MKSTLKPAAFLPRIVDRNPRRSVEEWNRGKMEPRNDASDEKGFGASAGVVNGINENASIENDADNDVPTAARPSIISRPRDTPLAIELCLHAGQALLIRVC